MLGFGIFELFFLGMLGVGMPGATSLSHSNPVLMMVAAPGRLLLPAAAWLGFGTVSSVAPGPAAVAPAVPAAPPPPPPPVMPIPVQPAQPAVPARPGPPVIRNP